MMLRKKKIAHVFLRRSTVVRCIASPREGRVCEFSKESEAFQCVRVTLQGFDRVLGMSLST